MCASWIAVWLRRIHLSAPFFTMGGIVILASISSMWIPETKGTVLPQEIHSNKVCCQVEESEQMETEG